MSNGDRLHHRIDPDFWRVSDPQNAKPPTPEEASAIAAVVAKYPTFGPNRIAATLENEGCPVSADTVKLWRQQTRGK